MTRWMWLATGVGLGSLVVGAAVGSVLSETRGVAVDPEAAAAAGIQFLPAPALAPAWSVTGIDGRVFRSTDYAGKVLVINFWATWCGPCVREVPEFVALQTRYADHVQFVGLAIGDEPLDEVRAFMEEHGVNYPVAQVAPDVEAAFGGLLGVPTSFLIDRRGRIAQVHIGWVNPAVYEQELRLLAGLPPLASR